MQCSYFNHTTKQRCQSESEPGQKVCYEHIEGCKYQVVKATNKRTAEYCHLIPEVDSDFCPKHALMVREQPLERQRWREKMERHKEGVRNQRAALETSPLRAENPAFAKHADVG